MKNHSNWLVRTGLLLAVLIALQALTHGQIVTGSCVNFILAVAALFSGLSSGLAVALLSPIFACLLGIAPNWAVVPAIMLGNCTYVVIFYLLCGKKTSPLRRFAALLTAAAAKFLVLSAVVTYVICGIAAQPLLAKGILNEKMLQALPVLFTWPQLITALIGGAIALYVAPRLKKKPQTTAQED